MISGCENGHTAKVKEDDTEYAETLAEYAEATIQETESERQPEDADGQIGQEADDGSTEGLSYPYDYLDVNDPRAQEIIADGWEEWILLESFYLSDYAGNHDAFWWDGLNSETLRLVETESFICISCAVSKESGLIEELGLNQWNISRNGFEISRW